MVGGLQSCINMHQTGVAYAWSITVGMSYPVFEIPFLCAVLNISPWFLSGAFSFCSLWKQAVLRKIVYRPAPPFSLLLRFFSIIFSLFSSRRRASSSSWSCLHLWKFSTTTPTNMLRTKKLTMRRKEIKYSSIQGLWFLTGWEVREAIISQNSRNNNLFILIFHRHYSLVKSAIAVTCWSTPTASSPSYMMLTQPSLQDSTNSVIKAWVQKREQRVNASQPGKLAWS